MNVNYNKIISKITTIVRYTTIFLIILKTQSVFTFLKEIDLHINMILVLFLVILTILRFVNKEIIINKYRIIPLAIYAIYITIYAILTKCTDRTFFVNFGIILMLFFVNLAFSKDFKEEVKKVAKIFVINMTIITAVSLFFFLFGSVLNWIKPSNQVLIEWGEERKIDSYCFMHFNTQDIHLLGKTIYRNSSIFTEAPMFALNLSFALAAEVFLNNKQKSKIAILVLGLISTVTLSAFINIFLIYIIWLAINYKNIIKDKKKIILNIVLLIVTICGALVLFNARSNSSSLEIRVDDYKASLQAFGDHVLLGNGYNNEEAIKKYMGDFRKYNDGVSNSIAVILAEGGIYLSLIYIIPQIMILYESLKNKNMNALALDIIFIVSMIISIYIFTPLMFLNLAIMHAYIYNIRTNKDKLKEENNIEKLEL